MSEIIAILLDYVKEGNAPGGAVFKNIKKIFPEVCALIEATQSGRCWTEKLYRYTHPDLKDSCKVCSQKLVFKNWERGYQTYCSTKCKHSDPEFKQKVKDTYIQNYGTDHPFKSQVIQQKRVETWREKYGSDNPAKTAAVQERMRQTTLERYGVENIFSNQSPIRQQMVKKAQETNLERIGVPHTFSSPLNLQKRVQTWKQKYGESHPHKCSHVREKYTETVQAKWGVDHPMQDAEILDKCVRSAKKSKKYVFPSGKEIMVQGHEPQALNLLLSEGISEDQIINLRTEMPKLWYINDKNKKSRYYPDFYIPHLNLIVEVKSEYTVQIRPDLLAKKKQAVLDSGYNYRLMIL